MSPENHHFSSDTTVRSTKRRGIWIRRLFSALAFGIVLYLFWPLIGEMASAVDLIKHAGWFWLGMALCVQFVSYAFLAKLNHLLLSPFDGRIGFWGLMAVLPAMAFIEVALPSAGLSGMVLRARLLGKNGYSAEASSFTLLMETVYIAVVMVVVSLAGVWYLLSSGGIRLGQLAILVTIMFLLIGTGILVYRTGSDKQRGSVWVEKMVVQWNRILRSLNRPQVSMDTLNLRTAQFYDGFNQLKSVPLILLLGLAVGRVLLDVVTLGLCFSAFHYLIPPGILLTGYGLILVFSGLAALPGGLGLVDVSLAVIFSRLGAPGAVAVAAALCYRLIAFWFLRLAGFVTWQVLEAHND